MPIEKKSTQKQVFDALSTERRYQDLLPKTRTDGEPRTVGDYLLMLEEYVHRARVAWVDHPGDVEALDVVRKVGGIAVHCMEDHGAIERVW